MNLSPSFNHQYVLKRLTPCLSYDGSNFKKWKSRLHCKLMQLLGDMPEEKCDLNVRTLWQKKTKLGRIDKVVFTSEPFCDVPAYVCIPKEIDPPYKFMICLQGHTSGMHNSIAVHREDESRSIKVTGDRDFALWCMRNGLAAMCIEQRSFGQRRELIQEKIGSYGCYDATNHALALGRTLLGERVYDVNRAIDYLALRGDADMKSIGIMGNSSGGTSSIYSAALSSKISYVIASCCFCTFKDSIMSIFHCGCNFVPGILKYADMADIAGLIAPRPLIIVSGRTDEIFPIKYTQTEFRNLKKIYKAADAEENCKLIIGDGGHRFYAEQTEKSLKEIIKNILSTDYC